MRHARSAASFILIALAMSLAFEGYWIAAWIGLIGFVWAARQGTLVGAYLGGLAVSMLVFGWTINSAQSWQPLILFHVLAIAWPVTVGLLRAIALPAALAFPVAWTIGQAVPTWMTWAAFGPSGLFYANRLAPTQVDLPLAQIADIAGMCGIEFLMAAVAGAVVDGRGRKTVALLMVAALCYGWVRLQQCPVDTLDVVIHEDLLPRLDEGCELKRADLHVWPESACRGVWTTSQWLDFGRHVGGTIVSGLARDTSNSAVVVDDSVRYVDKHFLVMGTEQRTPFGLGIGFKAGPPPEPARIAVPICYEITLPQAIVGRPEVIVNPASERSVAEIGKCITLAHAQMRAIESRRPVVRSVADGYSGTIDGNGRTGPIGRDRRCSVYALAGEWLLAMCAFALALRAIRLWRARLNGIT